VARPKSNAVRPPCQRCGLVHERCSGHTSLYDENGFEGGNKIGERPCRHWPMHGQRVCQTHGGRGRNKVVATAQWKKEQKLKQEIGRVERAVKTFGLPITVDPQTALLDEIYRTAGHVKWLGDWVGNLSPEDAVWGRIAEEHTTGVGEMSTENTAEVDMTKTVRGARPAVWYQIYAQERAHLVHVCKVAISCNISERQVKLAEEQGQLIAQSWRTVIEAPELMLTEIQITVARTLVSKALRSMSLSRPPVPSLLELNGNGH